MQRAATKRAAILTPVRIVCELDELLKRVRNESRASYFKTRDVEHIKRRFAKSKVFSSHFPNEFTLDVTHLTPNEAAENIFEWVSAHQL